MYKVSVVIPVYNAENYIERCARSLFEQTLTEIEYIFVNDCSQDRSIGILESVIEQYPNRKDNVRILHHEVNTGQSGARRSGMAMASGEYIIHCDADDWVDLNMYETMYKKAIEENVEAVCCDISLEYENHSNVLQVNNKYDDHRIMYDCLAQISVQYLSMCNRLISKKVFERHNLDPFEGVNMWDDVGLAVRLRFYIRSTTVINHAFYHYNQLNIASTTKRPLLDKLKEQNRCIDCIEKFFADENAIDKYKPFISFLRITAADAIFRKDVDKWAEIFKKERRVFWKVRHFYRTHMVIKYYVVSYGGCVGKYLWKKFWKR